MAEEQMKCPRCSWPVNPGETACESCGQDLASGGLPGSFNRRRVASPAPSIVCTNCHAFWPPATKTGMCPACGHELLMAGFTAPGSWPPVAVEQPLPYVQSQPLMTPKRGLDVALGMFFGLIAVIAAPITFGVSAAVVLIAIRKAFNTFPYYRRGVCYGGTVAALVLLSAYMAYILHILKI